MAHVSAPPAHSRGDAAPTFVAIAFVLLAVALFSAMDALSKILAATYDPLEVVWGRYLAILAMLAPLVLRDPRALATARLRLQLLRGRVGPRRWAAVSVGFLGVLIVVRPGSGALGWAALLPLLSAACWGLSLVVTRRMRGGDRPLTTLLYSTVIGFAASSTALPLVWQPPGAGAWALMVLMGALSAAGQYLLIAGLARGDASLLAPFSYSQMIWSTLTGFFVFGTVPTAWTWCGAAIIVASGIYIAHRERLRARAVS